MKMRKYAIARARKKHTEPGMTSPENEKLFEDLQPTFCAEQFPKGDLPVQQGPAHQSLPKNDPDKNDHHSYC